MSIRYVSRQWAMATNMSYVNAQGQAVMRVDNWSTLSQGQARNSVRIESQDVFNKGLFILDVEQAPWGSVSTLVPSWQICSRIFLLKWRRCGVWPAWWTVYVRTRCLPFVANVLRAGLEVQIGRGEGKSTS